VDGRLVFGEQTLPILAKAGALNKRFTGQIFCWQNKRPPNKAYTLTTSTRFICLMRAWLLKASRPHRFWFLLVAGEAAVGAAKLSYSVRADGRKP